MFHFCSFQSHLLLCLNFPSPLHLCCIAYMSPILSPLLLYLVFPLLFYLVQVSRSVVQDLLITPSSMRLPAVACRHRCAGLMLYYAHRLLALLDEALYCVCVNVLIVTLYSTHLLYCTSQ